MANGQSRQERTIPERGYRIMQVKKSIASQLNLLTDYIISPNPKAIDLRRDSVRLQIYSVLSEQTRSVQLPIINREIGLIHIRQDEINSCIMKVTKIFQGSPLHKHGIKSGQFIVGVTQGNYTNITTFAQLLNSIALQAPKDSIALGVCGEEGRTRIVRIAVSELKNWQSTGKGLLGCELAEGWIHKWKPTKDKKQKSQIPEARPTDQEIIKNNQSEIPKIQIKTQNQKNQNSDSSDEVDRKCDQLDSFYNSAGVMQINFKGILKQQQLADASTICKCRPINKVCERCFIQKEQNYYFFNQKYNQIVSIPTKLMMKIKD